MTKDQIVTVFGGSGFVGRAAVYALAQLGYSVRVASRNPAACQDMKLFGTPGQIVPQFYDPARPDTIGALVAGAYGVVNCVGILSPRGRATFHATHSEFPRSLATTCKRYNVARFIHVSALGVDADKSSYARSKLQGEKAVRDIFPAATILRPSVIFGPDDNFFNMFARMAQRVPFLPLIGGGKTKFQPVYVGDVAAAIVRAIDGAGDVCGKVYELGGPEVMDFRGIYKQIFAVTGKRRFLLPLPWGAAELQAFFMRILPNPPLTSDQIKSLRTDHTVSANALGFKDLGIAPTTPDMILPTYLARYAPGGDIPAEKKIA